MDSNIALYISLIQVCRIAYCGPLGHLCLMPTRVPVRHLFKPSKRITSVKKKELHLPAALRKFGPTSAYKNERYTNWICEANSIACSQNVHSNRLNPSSDITVGFSVREHLTYMYMYVVSGGTVGN